MSWVTIGVGIASIAIGQIIRVATAPSQLKVRNDVIGDRSETGVASGRYGDPIALQWGSGRLTGQLIWAKEIREQQNVTQETVTQEGGKGGGGGSSTTTTTTTFTYFGTFAVELCSNQIVGISKIWLNSKLFYENRPFLLGTPLTAAQDAQQYFTVYYGEDLQSIDPTISAAQGADLTPAYRNRAIIVFKELPLAQFGNRIPVVECLVHQNGSGSNLNTVAPMPTKLHTVVGYLCNQVGLENDDIDLTQLVDNVDGYQMSQRGNAQGFLRELQTVYNFGCVDTGKKLQFVSHPVPVNRDEYRTNCLINEDYLTVNSYHDILGRSGYFPSSAGTSEGQFAQIIAALRAYQATSDINWLNLANSMADALTRLYLADPPANPATLYTPHWLFNVKKNIQLQSSILTTKVIAVRQGNGTYIGFIPSGPGFYGDLIVKVTVVYGNVASYLVWDNPYSGVRGTSYPVPVSVATTSSGSTLTWAVNALGTASSLVVNCGYIVSAGKMLGVSENMEAWPHWRELEGGEIDCAVDTLAWALEAFDLLFSVTGLAKWQNAYNATVQTIIKTYDIDDGRFWLKKAKGSPFVLPGTFLVSENAPFGEDQITRNQQFQLEFFVSADGNATGTAINDYEIQFGRGIVDQIKPGDTHIRVMAKGSIPGQTVVVFLQDDDANLLTAFRWKYVLALSATLTTYDIPLGSFSKYAYPFLTPIGSGFVSGQQIRVAGLIFYPTASSVITLDHIRPIPQVQLPYTPSVAPYTANSVSGQLLDWAGGPGIGYQNAYVWARIGDATKRAQQLSFLSASQSDYTSKFPGTVGPFTPAYVWDRYDVLQIAGTPGTWTWNWPDPNSEWVGYYGRCVEGLGRCAYLSNETTAGTLCRDFLTWLNTNWPGGQYIPTNFPSTIVSRANSTSYAIDAIVKPASGNGRVYRALNVGTTGGSVPTFPTTIGSTVVDGTITWRCDGFTYGSSPVYGNYNEPHAAALFMRAACWYRLAGGTTALADSIITKCWNYMESLVVSSGSMAGTWSPNPAGQEWWGFWGSEIITSLSLLLTDFNAIRTANGISSTTIQTRIANYRTWLFTNIRSITIPKIDDVVTDDDYIYTKTQDVELPNEVIIKYQNVKNSGDPEARYTRRHGGYSDAAVNLALTMAMKGENASNLARTIVSAAWAERYNWEFNTRSLLVQPLDCFEYDVNGEIKRVIVHNTSLDQQGNTKVSGTSYNPTAYRISAPAPSESTSKPISLSLPGQTQATVFNLPALSATDDTPGYATGATGSNNWSGGSLKVSNDNGASYATKAVYDAKMTSGTVVEVLPPNRTYTVDRQTTLTVNLNAGGSPLESITETQLYNGGVNLVLLNTEMIAFQNATLIAENQYRISGFLRGLYGTEDQIYGHFAGESFTLINGAIKRVQMDLALVNAVQKGRSFTTGRPDTDFIDFNFTANGLNLLPYAPVDIGANRATDLALTWRRRARINAGWQSSIEVPLDEPTESYRVDLLTAPLYLSGTIIASYTTSTPSITITQSQIISAYGSAGATVHVAIRQISSRVGAGKQLEGSF